TFAANALQASNKRVASSDDCCLLREKLGATPAQWEKIKPRLTEFRRSCQEVCRQVNRNRQELIEMLAAQETTPEAVRAKKEEILAGQRKMQDLVVEHIRADKELLTPEQQQALFDLLRTRCCCDGSSGACPEKQSSSREESP